MASWAVPTEKKNMENDGNTSEEEMSTNEETGFNESGNELSKEDPNNGESQNKDGKCNSRYAICTVWLF